MHPGGFSTVCRSGFFPRTQDWWQWQLGLSWLAEPLVLYRPSPYESMEECNASPLAIRMRRESLNCGTRAMLFSSTVGGWERCGGKKEVMFWHFTWSCEQFTWFCKQDLGHMRIKCLVASQRASVRHTHLFIAMSDTLGATGTETMTKHTHILQHCQCVRGASALGISSKRGKLTKNQEKC